MSYAQTREHQRKTVQPRDLGEHLSRSSLVVSNDNGLAVTAISREQEFEFLDGIDLLPEGKLAAVAEATEKENSKPKSSTRRRVTKATSSTKADGLSSGLLDAFSKQAPKSPPVSLEEDLQTADPDIAQPNADITNEEERNDNGDNREMDEEEMDTAEEAVPQAADDGVGEAVRSPEPGKDGSSLPREEAETPSDEELTENATDVEDSNAAAEAMFAELDSDDSEN